jgi:hypothetical protein
MMQLKGEYNMERAGPKSVLFLLALGVALSLLTVQGAKANTMTPWVVGNTYDGTLKIVATSNIQGYSLFSHGTGSYETAVATDSANALCAGCIDIIAQVYVSTFDLREVQFQYFDGFASDNTYIVSSLGQIIPTAEPATGNDGYGNINYHFLSPLAPGQTSAVMVIETNARDWTAGLLSLQDGGTSDKVGFQPTITPEPSSASLLGFGLLGLVGMIRRKLFA